MFEWLRQQPLTLPPDAELALTAERVLWLRGVVVVGCVECDVLRLGDEVVAVGGHSVVPRSGHQPGAVPAVARVGPAGRGGRHHV